MCDVQIVSVDFYISSPISGLDNVYSEFKASSIQHVPVIRIFGPSKQGKKKVINVFIKTVKYFEYRYIN